MAKAKKKTQSKATKAAAKKTKPAAKKAAPKMAAKKNAKKTVQKSAKKASPKAASKAATKATAKTPAQAKPTAKSAAKPATKSTATKTAATPAKGRLKLVANNRDWSQFLTPLDDRILVQIAIENERKTAGGLFIPDTAQTTGHFQGTVVSVGPGHRDKKGHFKPLELRIGDQILFSEYAGTEVLLEEQNFKILRETDVLGIVTA